MTEMLGRIDAHPWSHDAAEVLPLLGERVGVRENRAVRSRSLVTPSQGGCVVAFDEQSDDRDSAVIARLAASLSRQLQCPVLAVLNHDDDILWYQLYLSGELADEYDSSPGYFDSPDEARGPEGGDAIKLCATFEAGDAPAAERVLRKSGEHGYTFAVQRHSDLVDALGLPTYAGGAGYRYVSGGELPVGLTEGELISVS